MTMGYGKQQPTLSTGLILSLSSGCVFNIKEHNQKNPISHSSETMTFPFSELLSEFIDMSSLACKKINSALEKKKKKKTL